MPLGDSDIASGVFFADFGVPVVFGGVTTKGNLDLPSASARFGGTFLEKGEYLVTIAANAFSPAPKGTNTITVNGNSYTVLEREFLDDGKLLALKLKAAL